MMMISRDHALAKRTKRLVGSFAVLLLVCVVLTPSALATGVHATSYEMDVRCTPSESRIEGKARVGLREVGEAFDTLHFWLHGELRVAAVRANGVALEVSQKRVYYAEDYSLVGNRVEVRLPERRVPDSIDVEWNGFMNPSRARSASDYMRIEEAGVFLRAWGYSAWFPLLLDQGEDEHEVDFHRVSIEVPNELTAVFAGDYVQAEDVGDSTRHVWRAAALSLSDAQLTARPFVVSTAGDVRVYALGNPTSLESGRKILGLTQSLLRYFRDHYSPAAVLGQVHVVEMPKYGDISSGNVVGIQEDSWRSIDDSTWAIRTLAHELVHPFVRPAISRLDPLHALVVEGFPSYYHYPALAALGAVDYAARISATRKSYLQKRETGKHPRGWPLPVEKAISEITADEIGIYKDMFILSDRTLLFLDELRRQMGQDGFENFNRELFAMKTLDDSSYRDLVLRYLPGFEEELKTWLDSAALPRALARR